MQALVESDVRTALGNASAVEREQVSLPVRFFVTEWAHLDAFGWRDPRIPERGYLVTELDGEAVGVVLRAAERTGSRHRAAICSLCHTQQPGDQVVLFSARRAGAAGERGDSVGTYICADLACQETIRLGRPAAPSEVLPSVRELERIEGLARRTRAFVSDVLGAS
ncbi:FBP domain-containing protein [Agromyces sp. CFH 90414]|uniref:FBP domain-containing protein n=1 Tax=Agromyces agglutinans TaxID=2662258 RepID=A0A6I2F5C3_9MICO|nr:FBP domain-containing protein [Agromyces agglutinans]MRG59544.1 FBP domain-containing protein [Agromyces agglutinans]